MPRAAPDPTTSRRIFIGATTTALLAGGAVAAMSLPGHEPAIPIIGANPDAELLALIARFDAIERQIWGGRGPVTVAEEEARDLANKPLEDEQKALLTRICSMPTHTVEGLQARARSLLAWDNGAQFLDPGPEDYPDDRMVAAILRGLAGEVRV